MALRLYRLNKYIDKFVVSYSQYTFSNQKIEFSLKPFESFIKQYEDKIIWVETNYTGNEKNAWERENVQKAAVGKGISQLKLNDNDLIILCDCDEIPTTEGMNYIIHNPPTMNPYSFRGLLYHFNYKHFLTYNYHVVITRYDYYNSVIKNSLKLNLKQLNQFIGYTTISYGYNKLTDIIIKYGSFSHSEFNKYPWTDPTFLYSRYKCYKDLYSAYNNYKKHEYNPERDPLPDNPAFQYLTKDVDFVDAKELVNFSDPSISCEYDILKYKRFKI